MNVRLILAVVVSVGLVLAGCGTQEADSIEASATLDTGPETRQVILDLALPTYDGGEFDPGSVKDKAVILWFWGAF